MGFAKYQEDIVSRYWRDAKSKVRMERMSEALPPKNPNNRNEIDQLILFRRRLAENPSDRRAQRDFHAEKARLEKLGVSQTEILGVIHGHDQREHATPSNINKDIVTSCVGDFEMNSTHSPTHIHNVAAHNSKKHSDQRTNKMSSLKKFAVAAPRPLPVIVLADASGSMGENGKIEALNAAIKDMVSTFSKESRLRAEIQVGLITFGGKAQMHLPLVAAHSVAGFAELKAEGATPMGAAFELARQLLEDKDRIPSRAYRPVLILMSDGQPTDEWESPFNALRESERAQKATRLAMAIGPDADEAMLRDFANDAEAPIFKAHNARDIHRFFRAVTMSITTRTASQNPDISNAFVVPPPDDNALDLDF